MLRDVRVVDLSHGIAGGYATKLFADAGADVIKVEPPEGDPLRRWSASDADVGVTSALFEFLHASKRSVVGTPSDPGVLELIAGADLVVESFAPGVIERLDLLGRFGSLVVLSLTPYGRGGPWSVGRPSTDFTVQAESGSIAGRGWPAKPPVQAGGRIAEWAAGTFGAPAALAAVRRARRTGRGDHVDVSMLECMTLLTNLFSDLSDSLTGRAPLPPTPPRMVEFPSIEPTKDGWVGFNTNAPQQFRDFLVLVERADLLDDESLLGMGGRYARRAELAKIVHEWTCRHTTAEIVERAAELRIPVAGIGNGRSLLEHEQLVARHVYVDDANVRFKHPRPPYLIDGRRLPPPRTAPRLGEHDGRIEPRDRPRAEGSADGLPFAGLFVLDATCWWAGPSSTQLLARLGADVVHVESIQRPDAMRMVLGALFADRERWWEYSSFFLSFNVNKRDLTLDLSRPAGVALARRLIERTDVLVENYSPRVFEHFGLDWDAVHAINPTTIMARMPAFGLDGPWRNHVAFAQTVEQFCGLAWISGHSDDPPIIPRGPGDPLAGMHAAFAIQVALAQRERTGEGVLVEAPLVESALNVASEQVIEWTAYGRLLERDGNRSPGAAPQGLYACREHRDGLEPWLALSVETDAQWRALASALGDPPWAADPALGAYAGRRAAHDDIDGELSRWTAAREVCEAVEMLLGRGVPAASLAHPRRVHQNPQMTARGFFEEVAHPEVGTHLVPTLPLRMSSVDRWVQTPAPTLGQHSREVLSSVLGLSDHDIAELERDEIVGSRPTGL